MVTLCGCRYQTSGKERQNEYFCEGMLFIDHVSRHVTIKHQTSLTVRETSLSLECVESFSRVTINHNHADNGIFIAASFHKDYITINHNRADDGIFTAASFHNDCTLKTQVLTFSAASSHYQKGVAERYIQSITHLVRAMI